MKLVRKWRQSFKLNYGYFKYFGFNFLQSLLRYRKEKRAVIFGKSVHFTHEFWFLHSLREIFIERVYLFKSDKKIPFILDCGANIGLSIIFFKQIFADAKIIGFEPDPINFQVLEKNIAEFGFSNVDLINKAVWKERDSLLFDSLGGIGSKVVHQSEISKHAISVEAVPLFEYIRSGEIDFLKIDIEGAEYEVLVSCKEHLHNVKNLFIEYHSLPGEEQVLPDLLVILRDAGFRYSIKEAWENLKHPYISQKTVMFDLQLNIFAYRP